jgi:capsular exopolysaccharide synthesis family protein
VLFSIVPRYTAESLVLVDGRSVNVVNLETAIAALPRDEEAVKSEIEILGSRGLAERVIIKLDLHRVEEFNEDLDGAENAPADAAFMDLDPVTRSIIINRFISGLAVSQRGNSRAISIEYTSIDAQRAANIANALADVYLDSQLEAKFEVTKRASSWLSDQISTLQEDLVRSEQAVERYREESGLLEAKGERLTSQEIAELNSEVLRARTATAEARARLGQIESQLQDSDSGPRTAAAVLDSAIVLRLTEQQADIRRRLAELSTEYGDLHPRIISLRAEAADLDRKIRTETDKVVAGLRYELAVASAREESLSKTLESSKRGMAVSNEAEIGLRALEREANANRVLLETMMSRFAETSAHDSMDEQQADSRIISRAQVPPSQSFPIIAPLLIITAFGGALLGLLSAFGLEALDQTIRSGEEIEQTTGMPSLGFIPEIEGASEEQIASYVLNHPDSSFADSLRNMVWGLKLRWRPNKVMKGTRKGQSRLPKSILITSSMTNEGKTTIAASLARVMAAQDYKVLLIDADCRLPSIHENLQLSLQPGLSEFLTGQTDFENVLATDEQSGARVITAGGPVADAPGLLGSPAFDELMRRAERVFDLVIVDSPPIMVGADAAIVSKKVAASILAVRWGATTRKTMEAAINELQLGENELIATVLSIVDASKHSQFTYGDSGRYAGKLAGYYGRQSRVPADGPEAKVRQFNGGGKGHLQLAESV